MMLSWSMKGGDYERKSDQASHDREERYILKMPRRSLLSWSAEALSESEGPQHVAEFWSVE